MHAHMYIHMYYIHYVKKAVITHNLRTAQGKLLALNLAHSKLSVSVSSLIFTTSNIHPNNITNLSREPAANVLEPELCSLLKCMLNTSPLCLE